MHHYITLIKQHSFLFISLAMLATGIFWESSIYNSEIDARQVANFEQELNQNILTAKREAQNIAEHAKDESLFSASVKIMRQQEIENTIHLFSDGELVSWNRNKFTSHKKDKEGIYFFGNEWFYLSVAETGQYKCKIFSPIKTEYEYENKFLKNQFYYNYSLPRGTTFSKTEQENYYPIKLSGSESILCYLSPKGKSALNKDNTLIAFFIYLSCWVFFLLWINKQLNIRIIYRRKLWAELTAVIAIFSIRILTEYFKAPYICYQSELYSPIVYASSAYLPSLADLIIHLTILIYLLNRIKKVLLTRKISFPFQPKHMFILMGAISGLYFFYINKLTHSIVIDSNIELQINKIFEFSVYSFIGIGIIVLLFHSLITFISSIFSIEGLTAKKYLLFSISSILAFLLPQLIEKGLHFSTLWFLPVLLFLFYIIWKKNLKPNSLFALISISLLCSSFINISLFSEYERKDHKLAELYARNLANEQDPLAEMLLKDIEEKMQSDSLLKKLTRYTDYTSDNVESYIRRKYFSGFLKKYELQTTFCGQTENFSPSNFRENCSDYFIPILKEKGISVPNSNFYYLDNQNGSISYLGSISFSYPDRTVVDIYIELNSKLITEELGYPELLLTESFNQNQVLKKFSYAKYNNKKLISQNGGFNYQLRLTRDNELIPDQYTYSAHGWKHHLFQTSPGLTIIVSKEDYGLYDLLVAISYIFGIIMLIHFPKQLIHKKNFIFFTHFNLQKKVQFSLFALLFTSLLLIAGAMLYLNYKQFENIEFEHAKEKMQSVVSLAKEKFGMDNELTKDQSNYLNYTLNVWSNTFFTDINLFGTDGKLLATSRPEIFEQKLIGGYMPTEAFLQMATLKQKEYICYEDIGEMSYISSYAVLTSDLGQTLGFINLPYFTKQKEQSSRITGVISAILNIYVLLIILASVAAALTAERLTKPLQLLKQKIGNIRLDSKNDPIEWDSKDELGEIIDSYNQMLAQLETSAHKLAESERKNAWQKIARQIAHEIKNPLTPMKLNLQFLQRAWSKKDEKFEERLNKISNSMIEQINSLAATANEFSNMAKISDIKKDLIELTDLVDKAAITFQETPNIEIVKVFPDTKLYTIGDSEKLIRVFNNIIKNAIQAMPEASKGRIEIKISPNEKHTLISFSDNGKGIDPELKNRLFEPNFTTKSSGMGLGLAICKNIIDSLDGKIWFSSKENEGTVFYIELIKTNPDN